MSFLPNDVFQHVFSFLPLHDNLVYASTSKVSMGVIIPELQRRRVNMKHDLVWKDCPLHRKMYYVKDSPFHVATGSDEGDKDEDVYIVPSALDRIRCLRRSISNRHPLYDDIHALVVDLEKYRCGEGIVELHTSPTFEVIFSIFQGIVKAHKLHSLLLHQTIYDNEMIHDDDGMRRKNDVSVSIHRFIGDVLIAYFLMGHVTSGIVEGVNESNWMMRLSSTDENLWYQRFIYYHSTLLRTLPMTPGQMIRMGLANEGIVSKMCNGKMSQGSDGSYYLIPQSPYCRGEMEKVKVILDKILSREGFVTLSCILYDFGSLGPAYRGRDNVRLMYLTPVRSGIETIEALDHMPISQYNHKQNITDVISSLRSDQFDPLSNLINLRRESKKTIPMNVKPGSVEVRVNQHVT